MHMYVPSLSWQTVPVKLTLVPASIGSEVGGVEIGRLPEPMLKCAYTLDGQVPQVVAKGRVVAGLRREAPVPELTVDMAGNTYMGICK